MALTATVMAERIPKAKFPPRIKTRHRLLTNLLIRGKVVP
jgi:hypothetical protein